MLGMKRNEKLEGTTMFRDNYLMAVRDHGPSSTTDTTVLYCLINFWADWKTGGKCYPSDKQLAKAVRCNPRYLTKVRKRLIEEGWIRVARMPGERYQYTLTIPEHVRSLVSEGAKLSFGECETQFRTSDPSEVRSSVSERTETELRRVRNSVSDITDPINRSVKQINNPPLPPTTESRGSAKPDECADGGGDGFSSDSSFELHHEDMKAEVIELTLREDRRTIDVDEVVPQAAYQATAPSSLDESVKGAAAPDEQSVRPEDFDWIVPNKPGCRARIEAIGHPARYALALLAWHGCVLRSQTCKDLEEFEQGIASIVALLGEEAFFAQVEEQIATCRERATRHLFNYAKKRLANPASWNKVSVTPSSAPKRCLDAADVTIEAIEGGSHLRYEVHELLGEAGFKDNDEAWDWLEPYAINARWLEAREAVLARIEALKGGVQ
jgi:hypothetical protein